MRELGSITYNILLMTLQAMQCSLLYPQPEPTHWGPFRALGFSTLEQLITDPSRSYWLCSRGRSADFCHSSSLYLFVPLPALFSAHPVTKHSLHFFWKADLNYFPRTIDWTRVWHEGHKENGRVICVSSRSMSRLPTRFEIGLSCPVPSLMAGHLLD